MEGYDKESLLGRGACAAGRAQSHGEPCKSPKKGCWCERSTKISARCSGFSKKNKYIVYHCFCWIILLRHIWKWFFYVFTMSRDFRTFFQWHFANTNLPIYDFLRLRIWGKLPSSESTVQWVWWCLWAWDLSVLIWPFQLKKPESWILQRVEIYKEIDFFWGKISRLTWVLQIWEGYFFIVMIPTKPTKLLNRVISNEVSPSMGIQFVQIDICIYNHIYIYLCNSCLAFRSYGWQFLPRDQGRQWPLNRWV